MIVSSQRIEIRLSKAKIVIMLLGALTFVALGLWFIISPPKIENSFWGNPTKIVIVGYASIIFFGLCALFFTVKLIDKKPGLIIDDKGVIDNSGSLSAGYIVWADIESISVAEIYRQRLITLRVTNPQHYIDRQKSIFKRQGMELNNKMCGTPLTITANGLRISFDNLLSLLTDKLMESRQ